MKKTINELEQELVDLKESHKSMWNTYGSELCAGDMIRKQDELQRKIEKLKIIEAWREAGLLDENDNPIPAIPDIDKIKELKTRQENGMDN